MSTRTYTACDMCGRVVYPDVSPSEARKWGTFHSGAWADDEEMYDLCPACCERVQRFVKGFEFNSVETRRSGDGDE